MDIKERSNIIPRRHLNIHFFLSAAIALLSLIGCGNSQELDQTIQYSSTQLQDVVDHFLDNRKDILGTIVRVDIQNNGSYAVAKGYFDRSRQTPIDTSNSFIIGSITKVFTAVLVFQLVEEGKVELQAPLIDYLPDVWATLLGKIEYGKAITVEHALSHRSGIDDITDSQEFWLDLLADSTGKWTALEILRQVQEMGTAKFAPGMNFDYCNTNYLLLGAVIEGISGESYRMSLQNNILDKIGLNNTFLSQGTFGSGKDGIAHGYYNIDDKYYDGQDISVEWALPEGGIISTAGDLIKLYKGLKSGLLFESKGTYRLMIQLVGNNESYGRGLEIIDDPELGLYYCHRGSFCNTRTMLAYFPDNDITIAICMTFDTRSLAEPSALMRSVIGDIANLETDVDHEDESGEVGLFILDSLSNVVENEDVPLAGDWNFDTREVWHFELTDAYSIEMPGNLIVDDEDRVYLLASESGMISVLDPDGRKLFSFGGYGDGPRFQYASQLFVTADNIVVLDIRDTGNKLKVFDKEGTFLSKYNLDEGVSPRDFVNDTQYVAIRSRSGPGKRPDSERFELLSLNGKEDFLLTMIMAENKLIASTDAFKGRCHVLLDDIEVFPRLIAHLDGESLYLGYSDRYLIKRVNLSGKEKLAFTVSGRQRRPLPPKYGQNQIAKIGQVCGKDIPDEMRKELVDGYPDRQVFFTQFSTDENGLVYVFVPDIINTEKQEVDIFSKGEYLYKGLIELPDGDRKIRPFLIKHRYLYALVKTKEGDKEIKKYEITIPPP